MQNVSGPEIGRSFFRSLDLIYVRSCGNSAVLWFSSGNSRYFCFNQTHFGVNTTAISAAWLIVSFPSRNRLFSRGNLWGEPRKIFISSFCLISRRTELLDSTAKGQTIGDPQARTHTTLLLMWATILPRVLPSKSWEKNAPKKWASSYVRPREEVCGSDIE